MFQPSNHESQMVFKRPSTNTSVEDGMYNAKILSACVKVVESIYHPEGRTVLNLKIGLDTEEGRLELYKTVTFSWSQMGKMIPLLTDLEVLPEPGEELDRNDLIGMAIRVMVQNVEKDNMVYSNIVSLKKAKVQKKLQVLPPKVTKEDLESIFEDDLEDELEDDED